MNSGSSSTALQTLDNSPGVKFIKEGCAEIIIPPGSRVFYNPVQEFNRDLSVSVLQVAAREFTKTDDVESSQKKDFRILEALAATGLRSIRYAKEIADVTEVVANDISENAIENLERNIRHNDVGHLVKSSHLDAVEVMFNHRHPEKRFQAVDLDPYGCPTPFLDTAVQCIADGGILLVTCTDMAVLCGKTPEACFVKYGAISLGIKSCHEMALRIALQRIQYHAATYKRYIVPLLSISVDFYIRLVVRVYTSALKCKDVSSKLSMVYQCTGCDTTLLQPLCVRKNTNESRKNNPAHYLPAPLAVNNCCIHCDGKYNIGGPIWSAPLHDLNFVREVINVVEQNDLKNKSRLLGVLNMIMEELHDIPLFYKLEKLCSNLRSSTVPMMNFRSAVLNGGYRISYSHTSKNSFKTDAPMTFVWDVLREWVKENSASQKNAENVVANKILSKPSENKIDFSLRPDANPTSRKNKMLRFQINPTPYWGPGSRSAVNLEEDSKKIRNQNKKKRKASEVEDHENHDVKKKK